jgi:hypothetical protein
MKHLKTFEGFEHPVVNEEFLNFGMKSKEKKFRADLDTFIKAWSKRMDKPTPEEIEKVVDEAKAEKFEGKPGLKEVGGRKKLAYRSQRSINWTAGGHSFGSGD